jgi:hypothetical protein
MNTPVVEIFESTSRSAVGIAPSANRRLPCRARGGRPTRDALGRISFDQERLGSSPAVLISYRHVELPLHVVGIAERDVVLVEDRIVLDPGRLDLRVPE